MVGRTAPGDTVEATAASPVDGEGSPEPADDPVADNDESSNDDDYVPL